MGKIKLPNNWNPRAYQRPLWDYLEEGGRHAVAVWHRRSGKDDVALHRTCIAAHERVGNYWHMLPEYSHARKAIWDAINPNSGMRRVDEAFPVAIRKSTNNQEMKIELKSGSIWQLVGSDNFNALIGSPPIGIVYSEWAVANPKSHGYLRPILAENNGWSLFIYTSRGYNHGFTTYEAARKDPKSFAQRLTVENTGVFSDETLESERRAYLAEYGVNDGDALYRQEFFCDFSASNIGAILGRYVEQAELAGRINEEVEYDSAGAAVEISADIGFRDTAAWWFWQPRYDGFALIDYDEDSGIDAQGWIPRLEGTLTGELDAETTETMKRRRGYKLAKIHLPHDATHKTFAWRHSVYEQFSTHFGFSRIGTVPISAKTDRINAGRVLMPLSHFNRTRCEAGLSALRSWSFQFDDERKVFSKEPLHDWSSHGSDAYTYGAQVMRERKMPKKPRAAVKTPRPHTYDWALEKNGKRLSTYKID